MRSLMSSLLKARTVELGGEYLARVKSIVRKTQSFKIALAASTSDGLDNPLQTASTHQAVDAKL